MGFQVNRACILGASLEPVQARPAFPICLTGLRVLYPRSRRLLRGLRLLRQLPGGGCGRREGVQGQEVGPARHLR